MTTTGFDFGANSNTLGDVRNIINKPLLVLFLFAGIVGLVFSLSYLLVNVIEIPQKIESQEYINLPELKKNNEVQSEKIEDQKTNEKTEYTLANYLVFLRAISIDLSAITPFLLSWYFYNIVLNTCKVLFGRTTREDLIINSDVLPMHLRYEVQWIQLGLLGTLWGFMIIGWGMKDVVTGGGNIDTLNILLKAFGTALLSTFTGTALAYVLGPIAIYLWQRTNSIPQDRDDLDAHLQRLGQRLKDTNAELHGTDFALKELKDEIAKLKEGVARISPSEVISLLQTFTNDTKNIFKTMEAVRIAVEKSSTVESLKPDLAAIKDIVEQLKNDLTSRADASESLKPDLIAIKNAINLFKNDISNGTQTIERYLEGLSKSFSSPMLDLAKVLAEKINQTEAEIGKNTNTHTHTILEKLETLEKMVNSVMKIDRSHTTIEVKDLEKITDLNEKLINKINNIMHEAKLNRKRSFWSKWSFRR